MAFKLNQLDKFLKESISLKDFVETWKDEGYGIALIDKNKKVISAYVDPSDFPEIKVSDSHNNAEILNGPYKGGHLKFHSGALEEDIYDDDDAVEPSVDIGSEMEKFADAPEADVEGEEGAIPAEASEEIEGGFEMEQEGDGEYAITLEGKNVCRVTLTCQGEPIDMATVENPSECVATITDVLEVLPANVYVKKLEDMGFQIASSENVEEKLPESESHLLNKSNQLLEE